MSGAWFIIGVGIGCLIGPMIALEILDGRAVRWRRALGDIGKRAFHGIHVGGRGVESLIEKGKQLSVGLFLRSHLLSKQKPLKSVCQPASKQGAEDYASEGGKEIFKPHGQRSNKVSEGKQQEVAR